MSTESYELFQSGLALLEVGKPAAAVKALEAAKDQEPGKASIREALGRAYYNSGKFDFATWQFKKTLAIEPTNDFAHFGTSLSLERVGRYNKAMGHIKMALAMKPDNLAYQRLALRIEIRLVGAEIG